jgi:hypothetical protein
MLDATISDELRAVIKRELERDERINWVGAPRPTYFTSFAIAEFLFAIPWTAFALFFTVMASGFKFPDFSNGFEWFPLFGIPFVLIGFRMLTAPLRVYRQSLKTVYVITDRRAITFEGGRTMTVHSYPLADLSEIYRVEHKDGTGDVILAKVKKQGMDGDAYVETRSFMRIANPFEVERRLKELAAACQRANRIAVNA